MGLRNIKNKENGFTIVELLIVIVIIGILAALVIVAYTGIQNRARTTKANTNATALQKKLEAYAADDGLGNGKYPTLVSGVNGMTGTASLSGTGITAIRVALDGSSGQTNSVQFLSCASGDGYQLKYWDYTTGAASTNTLTGGTQTTCALPAS